LLGLPLAAIEAATINVTPASNSAGSVQGFRYVIEEDRTFDVIPGCTGLAAQPAECAGKGATVDTLSLQFHRSYMPVVATGESAGSSASVTLDPTKRYFVSVLPLAVGGQPTFAMGGAPLRPGQDTVNVTVDVLPLKTAQISIFIYNDDNPINNQADAPNAQERGLCGFEVHLYDAGGTYGASGGRISTDTFGNPLGTSYDANGNPVTMGGVLRTDANGVLRIKNLAPGKYTGFALPPMSAPSKDQCPLVVNGENIGLYGPNRAAGQIAWGEWHQTSTIEGTWGIDAWVKAGEPSYFKEFGPPGHHIDIGFVKRFAAVGPGTGPSSVSGRVVHTHMSRPPAVAFYNGEVDGKCWIGLNEIAAGAGAGNGLGVYANACNPDGTFRIEGLKANTRYQLAVWDTPLDNVFGLYEFVTPAGGGAVALNDVPVFRWFGAFEGKVCYDKNENGICEADEVGIPGQAFNLRFRDGSIYQSAATDDAGNYELAEVFPFFNWMVTEIDYSRFKATGATFVVDAGGPVDPSNPLSRGKLTPQVQPDGAQSRTETGVVLTQGSQTFLGTTNVIDFGKAPYKGNEHGGISGIVHYASTRAEWDPRLAAAENNEPGIPGVEVRLYRADPNNKKAALGAPIAVAVTDSWDDAVPTGCVGEVFTTQDGVATDCYDGLRNYNQMRPGVFDGGYAFSQYCANGWGAGPNGAGICPGGEPVADLVPGNYIVEVVPPAGYEIQKEEDKNVDFGEFYTVATQALPPECVGSRPTPVPAELDLFPGVAIPAEYRDQPATATSPARPRPYCNRKAVTLLPQLNAAADFHLFTKVPVAGHIVGMILDDLANEFSPYSPNFGEKFAPPFMPISLRDQGGREFSRVYSDRYGTYNALVPSTFAYNIPMPSGVSPNMVQACLNSPYMTDPATGRPKLDPHFNKSYTQFCYTFQYLPGKTTYLDTPVLPIAAFAGPQQYALDCEAPDLTPAIAAVNNAANTGPWAAGAGATLTVTSLGPTEVLNPLYNADNPGAGVSRLVTRNYGFGTTAGTVTLNGVAVPAANISSWTNDAITLTLPAGASTGTLLVTAANGRTTARGVTVHVGGSAPFATVRAGQKIQDAIDAAPEGALITVGPGVYEEPVIVHKRVRVQGFGAGSTLINAVKQPTEKLAQWRSKVCSLVSADVAGAAGAQYLLPGQAQPATMAACETGDTADNAPLLFGDHEGPGFFVLVRDTANPAAAALQIDGFTISGADQGGGVMVNGYARRLQISNNRITGNQGIEAGGIQVGHANLLAADRYVDGRNSDVSIHHNEIVQNGNTAGDVGGAGGGIGLFTGSDRYRVSSNFICGNYSTGDGGGIGHQGLSLDGVIENNRILWNQAFNQGNTPNGGGISITGDRSLVAANGLSTGSGSVKILNNLLQGNHAGAGDGGAISLAGINGTDATTAPYAIDLFNNVIVDNVAGLAGGGVALQDAIAVRIINNTIAHNDSTATGSRAFTVAPNTPGLTISQSTPQPGVGIAARGHSPALNAALGLPAGSGFSNPQLVNTILLDNRMFHWRIDYTRDPTSPACQVSAGGANSCYGLVYDGVSDLAVRGGTGSLNPQSSVLTNVAANAAYLALFGNVAATSSLDPTTGAQLAAPLSNVAFLREYVNGGRDAIVQMLEQQISNLQTAAALDEGGNFIDTRFGPLTPLRADGTPFGDYRVGAASVAKARATTMAIPELARDAAGVLRGATGWTVGAYEAP
jgi:hypothetical protein